MWDTSPTFATIGAANPDYEPPESTFGFLGGGTLTRESAWSPPDNNYKTIFGGKCCGNCGNGMPPSGQSFDAIGMLDSDAAHWSSPQAKSCEWGCYESLQQNLAAALAICKLNPGACKEVLAGVVAIYGLCVAQCKYNKVLKRLGEVIGEGQGGVVPYPPHTGIGGWIYRRTHVPPPKPKPPKRGVDMSLPYKIRRWLFK